MMSSFEQFYKLVKRETLHFRQSLDSETQGLEQSNSLNNIKIPPFEFQHVVSSNDEITYSYLVSLHDHVFVNQAFLAILNRPADSSGMDHYLGLLRSGKIDKTGILVRLWLSRESRLNKAQRKVQLPLSIFIIELLNLTPILGLFFGWFRALIGLRGMQRQINENLAHSIAMNVHLQGYLREVATQVESSHNSLLACHLEKVHNQMESREYFEGRVTSLQSEIYKVGRLQSKLLDLKAEVDAQRENTSSSVKQIKKDLDTTVNSFENKFSQLQSETLEQLTDHNDKYLKQLAVIKSGYKEVDSKLEANEVSLGDIAQNFGSELKEQKNALNALISELNDNKVPCVPHHFYEAFESEFRGSREDIIHRLQHYLPEILDLEPLRNYGALDLACGRGEWIQLLNAQGFKARGIDINQATNDACLELGLDVETADILEYLRRQPEESVGLVSAFHIVEHLPFELLFQVLKEIHRVLAPKGVVILETPNPENLMVGANTFYIDPTHLNPLPSPLLEFLTNFHGFESRSVPLNPHPTGGRFKGFEGAPLLDNLLFGSQDYAVIGSKL